MLTPSQYTATLSTLLMLAGLAVSGDMQAQTPAMPDWTVLDKYCVGCHNEEDWAGQIAFDSTDRNNMHKDADLWERTLRKLRSGMMPPAGESRPARAILDNFSNTLALAIDANAATHPGHKSLSRLNKKEYINAVRDLLAFDLGQLAASLPDDTRLDGFDNMAETLTMSPTLLDAYLSIAMEVSRQAVGNPDIGATDVHFYRNGKGPQLSHVDGQALGTRGGMQITHQFPLDAEYVIRVKADMLEAGWVNPTHHMFWCNGPAVTVSFNGTRIPVDEWQQFRVSVPAGKQQLSVALLDDKRCAGVGETYLGQALESPNGAIEEIEIQGPYNGKRDTSSASYAAIFGCQPQKASEEEHCARDILSYLATRGWRRLVTPDDSALDPLLAQYRYARDTEHGDFHLGIQYALARLLVDPRFLYRFEQEPAGLNAGATYAIGDFELASRLSFFLWSSIPDEALLQAATEGRLSKADTLQVEVTRMLADPKARTLVDNFAGQWLKLRALADAAPIDKEFDEDLRRAMIDETTLFFASIVQGGGSMLTLLDADYTFLNERLARHYGIAGIKGSFMRRVQLPPDSPRRGLLGQASLLTANSIPNRTSPVVRGVWIVENLLGAPIPNPPPGVEVNLDKPSASSGRVVDTLRARLQQHRADPVCGSCHGIMDPIGLTLENFDLTGRWRDTDNGKPVDAHAVMADGTALDGTAALRGALLARSEAFINTLSGKLLSYALGRELSLDDGPSVRHIVRTAEQNNYSFAALISGIVSSEPFRLRVADGHVNATPGNQTASARP